MSCPGDERIVTMRSNLMQCVGSTLLKIKQIFGFCFISEAMLFVHKINLPLQTVVVQHHLFVHFVWLVSSFMCGHQ